MVPLREGKVAFSFNGIGTYFSQEGVDVFGTQDWGPQEVRILLGALGNNCLSVFAAGDIGVKTLAGLKGKRVAYVKGSPALNNNTLSHLRFGNLTWDDVEKGEVGGNNAAFEAVLNNQADAFFSTTNSGNILKVQNSPRNLVWLPLPHDDTAGWERLRELGPYFSKNVCSESSGNLPAWEAASYSYPLINNYAKRDADDAYAMTKAMFEQFPNFKDAAPATAGYALEKQVFDWVLPFHEGAIRFYKEVGKWTPEAQANNDKILVRQEALQGLWKEFMATEPDEDGFYEKWMEFRYAGLQKVDQDPIWKTFK